MNLHPLALVDIWPPQVREVPTRTESELLHVWQVLFKHYKQSIREKYYLSAHFNVIVALNCPWTDASISSESLQLMSVWQTYVFWGLWFHSIHVWEITDFDLISKFRLIDILCYMLKCPTFDCCKIWLYFLWRTLVIVCWIATSKLIHLNISVTWVNLCQLHSHMDTFRTEHLQSDPVCIL